ncbi:Sec-independent protein translocase protein TatB [Mycobacterium sp. MYCO198283]|uniref:Sec-independent protein translocase protein TatB n=1 Tax=Mycobacterium sp. MYCO198283 TaxID=2883505 RepID=UPI001E389590|nr:Sec-independent protein translocase protein TatB [Mycobacterium sp. MYCO198283]MCG5430774.1 Sec-independent protein translocase protein TatB [Mycobacterium sp. MYCO198283]
MFSNIGWGELLVLLIAALVILGPERLPGAVRWTSDAVRQARDFISGATTNLRDEFGPEFDDLREPLAELQKLRGMTPRAAITKHLLDGDDSLFTGNFDRSSAPPPPVPPPPAAPVVPPPAAPVVPPPAASVDPPPAAPVDPPPTAGGTPYDGDAT